MIFLTFTAVTGVMRCNKYFEFKNSWGASAPKLELLAVQWLSSNLCKVGSYVRYVTRKT